MQTQNTTATDPYIVTDEEHAILDEQIARAQTSVLRAKLEVIERTLREGAVRGHYTDAGRQLSEHEVALGLALRAKVRSALAEREVQR